jgi:hypothetical protein
MAEKISRRKFIRVAGTGLAALGTLGAESCRSKRRKQQKKIEKAPLSKGAEKLPQLDREDKLPQLENAEKPASSKKPGAFPGLKKDMDKMRAELKLLKKNLVAARKAKGKFGPLASQFARKQRVYRSYHIAYAELRGKKRDQIERPLARNRPNEAEIARIKKQHAAG